MTTDTTEDVNFMLTTIDNPFNPFTQYDEWYGLDRARGYNTPGLLARYVITSDELGDQDQQQAINLGMLEVIRDNPFGMYKRVTRADFDNETSK